MKNVSSKKWIAAWLCCFITFLQMGAARLSGMFFPSVMDTYGVDRSQASFPFFLVFAVKNIAGPSIGYLGARFGVARLTVIGCLLSSISVGASFIAESVVTFTILWAVYGLGTGFSTMFLPQILNRFFEKRTSLANGISFGGASLAGFALPPLVDVLQESYGLQGTLLILSALMLNSVPLAMLLRKLDAGIKDSSVGGENENGAVRNAEELDIKASGDPRTLVYTNTKPDSHVISQNEQSVEANHQEMRTLTEYACFPTCEKNSTNLPSKCSTEENSAEPGLGGESSNANLNAELNCDLKTIHSEEKLSGQVRPVVGSSDSDVHQRHCNPQMSLEISTKCYEISNTERIQARCKTTEPSRSQQTVNIVNAFKVFGDTAFLLILATQSLLQYVRTFLNTIIVDFGKDGGVQGNQLTYLVMTLAISDAIGRFFLGIVTDLGLMSFARFCFIGFAGMGVVTLLLNWFGGFSILMIALSFFGLLFGGLLCVFPGVCSENILPEQLTVALTSRYFLFGLLSFTPAPLVGLFRSQWGSYKPIIILLSVISFACALMVAVIPSVARRRDERRKKTISETTETPTS